MSMADPDPAASAPVVPGLNVVPDPDESDVIDDPSVGALMSRLAVNYRERFTVVVGRRPRRG